MSTRTQPNSLLNEHYLYDQFVLFPTLKYPWTKEVLMAMLKSVKIDRNDIKTTVKEVRESTKSVV